VPEGSLDLLPQFYDGKSRALEAQPVAVGEGAVTAGIDAELIGGATVTGVVTGPTAEALAGIEVCAEPLAGGLYERCTTTSATEGAYSLVGLSPGLYALSFSAPASMNYATEFYDGSAEGTPEREGAEPVELLAEGTRGETNARMNPGGVIEGTVVAAKDSSPLAGIEVCAFQPANEVGRCALTAADGSYEIDGLADGATEVSFEVPFTSGLDYVEQFYDDKSRPGEADLLAVEETHTLAGIDAALVVGAPVPLSEPTIAGRAVEGETLTATHASWTGEPSSYLDEWDLCPAGEVSEACATIGTGDTLTLTAADVGGTIALLERAGNAGGLSASYADSRNTAIVVQRAPEAKTGGSPPPGGQVGQQGLGGGVLGSTSRLPSVAQLEALLAKLLRQPTGHAAVRIGSLLGHDGYALTFRALAAGSLEISWYAQPHGARHPVLVAHLHLGMAGAGRVKAHVQLTPRGRRVLRHAPHAGLRVLAKGVLVASGGSQTPVSASRHLTVVR
jgi:hypothetical protein